MNHPYQSLQTEAELRQQLSILRIAHAEALGELTDAAWWRVRGILIGFGLGVLVGWGFSYWAR